ncbi:MAG: FAD-dependent oxidoreductase, partial [Pseudomonadota bacterium]|nr:FAD-dependent oxidoreductase [Pseudomonadota bacterium]
MSQTYDVIVVGAGITGASTAYHLKRNGVTNVALFERHSPAAGGTGKSAAIVRQHYSTTLLARLTQESIKLFRAMPDEIGANSGYVRSGWCFLVPEPMLEAATANVELLQSCGIDTRFLVTDEVRDRFPWLNPQGVSGVVYEPD